MSIIRTGERMAISRFRADPLRTMPIYKTIGPADRLDVAVEVFPGAHDDAGIPALPASIQRIGIVHSLGERAATHFLGPACLAEVAVTERGPPKAPVVGKRNDAVSVTNLLVDRVHVGPAERTIDAHGPGLSSRGVADLPIDIGIAHRGLMTPESMRATR